MPSNRFPALIFVVAGLGLIFFRRAVARHQINYNRNFYSQPAGRALYVALSYIVPGGWVIIGALAFLGRIPSTGQNARTIPYTGLNQGELVGLITFVVGALLLVFHGPLLRRYERQLEWQSTPAGERYMEWLTALIGAIFAGVGTLAFLGILT